MQVFPRQRPRSDGSAAIGTTLSLILRVLSPWAKRQTAKARLSGSMAWALVCSDLDFSWLRLGIFSWLRAVDQKNREGAQISWHLPCLSMGGGKIPKCSIHTLFIGSQSTFLLSGHKPIFDAAQKLSQCGASSSWRAPEPVPWCEASQLK